MFGNSNDGPFAKGPGAMEKMIASMLGFTPEEMAKTLTDFRDTIVGVDAIMKRIEAKLDALLATEKVIEHARIGNDASGGGGSGGAGGLGSGGSDTIGAGERDAA